MSHTWSIVVAKIDLIALYFRLLWYHSILRDSIDQKHTKTNEIWRQNSEMHPAFASSRWPPWFADLSRPYAACVKGGSGKHMFGLSLFRPSRRISPRRAKKDSNIPPPPHLGEQDNSNALPQGLQRQSNPHTPCPASPPPPPRRHNIDRCVSRGRIFAFINTGPCPATLHLNE